LQAIIGDSGNSREIKILDVGQRLPLGLNFSQKRVLKEDGLQYIL
jgi:hypothetical protein